jgi:hypothetical protein
MEERKEKDKIDRERIARERDKKMVIGEPGEDKV